MLCFFFFSSRRRHTRLQGDWSSDVCSSDLRQVDEDPRGRRARGRPPVGGRGGARVPGDARGGLPSQQPRGGAAREIGRASCRERGEVAEGGGADKIKRQSKGREK